MNTFTSAITIPNIQKCRLKKPLFDADASTLYVNCEVQGTGGIIYSGVGGSDGYLLQLKNGTCTGLRATASPIGFNDRVELFTSTISTGYTDGVAAFNGGGATDALKLKALETYCVAQGLLPAGTVS
jgi:hypothetical protein